MIAGIGITVYLTQFTQIFKPKAAENPSQQDFIKMADSSDNGYPYAYAPSIIKKDGKYHVFYCSTPVNHLESWDTIRYISSTDGRNWSTPVTKVITVPTSEGKTSGCDPSLVYYQGYYYLYYSSVWKSKPEFQVGTTIVSVARSQQIDGTYLTYTDRGTWEERPGDAKKIITPIDPYQEGAGSYGAGQQSVIEKDGKLIMFHTDEPPGSQPPDAVRIYKRESTNPVDWTGPAVMTNISAHSPDIKYDPVTDQFILAMVFPFHSVDSSLMFVYSKDGITWHTSGSTPYLDFNWPVTTPLIPASSFPNFTHNVGMSSDDKGHLLPGPVLIGFGAPYDLNPQDTWSLWDLYGIFVDINVQPIGFLGETNCQHITGWACEIDNISASTEIHLYFDGIPGSGAYGVPGIIANIPREPAVGANCGGNSSKGYSYPTPEFLKDGNPHQVRAYAINTPPGSNPELLDSPKTIQCTQPSPSPSVSVPPTESPSPSPSKPGDTDNDNDVDIFDYNLILTDFGKINDPNTKADLDNDNDVDIFDYNLVLSNFGR